MLWKGMLLGSFLGSLLSRSWVGSLVGAFAGQWIEMRYFRPRTRLADSAAGRDPLDEAYRFFGASPADSDDALRRKYRDLAKKCHPDTLRAQGAPESKIDRATDLMGRVNAAWSTIRTARGI